MSLFKSSRPILSLIVLRKPSPVIKSFPIILQRHSELQQTRNMSSIKYELDLSLLDPKNEGKLLKFPAPKPGESSVGILCQAAINGNIDAIRIASIEDCNAVDDSSSNTCLIWAVDADQLEVVKELLKKPGINVNTRGFLGATALSRACRRGNNEIVSLLLSHPDIDANIPNGKLQYPLHFAAFQQHNAVVSTLLECGKCDVLVRDRKGRLPVEDTKCPKIKELFQPFMKEDVKNT